MAVVDLRPRLAGSPEPIAGSPRGADPSQLRAGYVAAWATLGLVLVGVAISVWIRWISSAEEFSPAPIIGPDQIPQWNLVVLRIEEALSGVEMAVLFGFAVINPLRRLGRLGLDAKIMTGCLIGSVTDGVLNMHQYLFAWNSHSINLGSWASFIPTASPQHQSRYAEALVWGIPMYTYFCIGVAVAGCALIKRMRARDPHISNVRAFGVVFGLAVIFDLVVENLVVRLGHGYAFARTPEALTLFPGSQFQFPLYETVSVALLGVLFTGLRLSAHDSPDGLAYVERGFERLRPALQAPARWLAVIGWCILTLFVVYHLPFQFFGLSGDSVADLPSYMLPGD